MTAAPQQVLTDAITDLLTFAWHHRDHLSDPDADLGEQLAARLAAVSEQATVAARVHDYLHVVDDEESPDPARDSWGRRLTLRALFALGIVGMLRSLPEPVVPAAVVTDLVAYLAGPPVAGERMFVIDADLPLAAAHDVAGWQLTRLEPADLDSLTPLPSTRQFAAEAWDEALREGGCVVLRRISDDVTPRVSTFFPATLATDLTEPELTIAAWEPLLLINLAADERVIVAAEYELERGRVVDRVRGTGLGMTEDGNGVHTWEVPAWGPYRPLDTELDDMLLTVAVLDPLLRKFQDWPSRTGPDRKAAKSAAERLRRSAHRLLSQGPRLGTGGDVIYPRDRAEVVFWFMSALENLLVTDSGGGDFTRKLAQRTAVLIGADDNDRLGIYRDVITGYRIRSKVAHGDVIPLEDLKALPARLYGCLREVFRALIILGPLFKIDIDCDEALLSAPVRRQRITAPVRAVVDALPETTRGLRPRAVSGPRTARRRRRRA